MFWIDRDFPPEYNERLDLNDPESLMIADLFAYVPAMATDNPHIDPAYWRGLNTLPDHLRRAFRDGDWSIFVGQAFQEWRGRVGDGGHLVRSIPVPDEARLYMSFDWGFGKPFSVGWWWEDRDNGRLFRFDEWYGWSGKPNEGIRLSDGAIADGIVERERGMSLGRNSFTRLAGPDCFAKKPDYRGGGQGPSTADVFAERGLYLSIGDNSRVLGKRQFHERLAIQPDGLSGMLIYECCEQFARTIPNLVVSPTSLEDVDTHGEDHVYDEARFVLMARSMSALDLVAIDVDSIAE
jgi:hypothetical protein